MEETHAYAGRTCDTLHRAHERARDPGAVSHQHHPLANCTGLITVLFQAHAIYLTEGVVSFLFSFTPDAFSLKRTLRLEMQRQLNCRLREMFQKKRA